MSEASLVAFNLLVNAIGSFAVGALVAWLAMRALRGAPGRAAVWLATLPFAKVILDVARGVPDGSFLWLRAQGVTQDLGSFRVGFGLARVVPKIDLSLGALHGGVTYPQSGADALASGLLRHVGAWAPAAIVAALACGAMLQLGRRLAEARRAAVLRRRVEAIAPIAVLSSGRRRVALHVVPELEGSPFTGGVLRPFVAFPASLWSALGPAERDAAIAHELAHVDELHVPWAIATGVVCDVFWFVPFIRRCHARLVAMCEIAADAIATRRGADPIALASALVRTREVARDRQVASAFVLGAARSALGTRVDRLLRPAPAPGRLARWRSVGRVVLVAWSAAIVGTAVLFGNH